METARSGPRDLLLQGAVRGVMHSAEQTDQGSVRTAHQQDAQVQRLQASHGDPRAHKFKPQTRTQAYTFPSTGPESPGRSRAPVPTTLPFLLHPLGTVGCSPSFRCPGGRCLPARTGGCSRVRSPHGCHCRRSRASTPGSRTRKSTGIGGRHPPGVAAGMVQGTARGTEWSGLRTPASWCRAQGRAQAASGSWSPARARKDRRTRTPGLAPVGRSS
jgi:hypothetical protein